MMIVDSPPDIIAITEVIPKAQQTPISMARISIPDYSPYLNFDPELPNLGASGIRGIALFISDKIVANETAIVGSVFSEQLWLEISLKDDDTLLLGCIYRSPSGSLPEQKETTNQLCKLISLAMAMNPTHLVIMGDFNFPDIDWKNGLSTAGLQHHSHDFIRTTQDSLLFQHVLEPTRYRPGTVPNLLDLIFSNEDGIISNLSYLPGLGESDHQCLDFTLECYAPTCPDEEPKANVNRGDYDKARTMMEEIDWSGDMADLDLSLAFNVFADKFENILKECIPKSKPRHKQKNIYMTKEALRCKKKKYHAWKRYTDTREYIDYARFTQQRNQLRKLTRNLQLVFENKLAREVKTNPKAFWKYANSRLKTRTRIDNLDREDGTRATTNKEKVEEFNKFFSSVFTDEDLEEIPSP